MRIVASIGLLFVVLGLCGGSANLWSVSTGPLIPAGSILALSGAAIVLGTLVFQWQRGLKLRLSDLADPRTWTLGLLFVFVSDWLTRPWGYMQGPSIRGELLLGLLISFALLQRRRFDSLVIMPVATAALLTWSFFEAANGRLLFSDDHAMFFFRLSLLTERFPSIPFWSPVWNAGLDARDFFATGALNAFLVLSPLLYLFELKDVYNVGVALLLWGLVPACTYVAVRLSSENRLTAGIAATLAMCTGLVWYRWALKYGTMGFVTSSALFPLVVALGIRFITRQALSWFEVFGNTAALTIMLLWSPSGLALAPLALVALPFSVQILTNRRKLLTLISVTALTLPWVVMFAKVSAVGSFVKAHKTSEQQTTVASQESLSSVRPSNQESGAALDKPTEPSAFRHKASGVSIRKGLDALQEKAMSTNPLLVVFSLPALLLMSGFARIAYGALGLWLLVSGTLGVTILPQLELDRMLVIGSILMSYPVAKMLTGLFEQAGVSRLSTCAAAVSYGYLLVSPLSASGIVLNRSLDKYSFLAPTVSNFITTLRDSSRGGRVVFSGCVLHELSGGHLAPLALWTNTPLVASSYAHNIWRYEQIIPKSYMARGEAGWLEYFDHMNATVVLAHEPSWRDYFSKHPEAYQEIARHEGFIIYSRTKYTPSYFQEGLGELLRQDLHSLTIKPLTERVVLKFKYYPFLKSSSCTLRPYAVSPEISFIELSGCTPNTEVRLESVSPYERLFTPELPR